MNIKSDNTREQRRNLSEKASFIISNWHSGPERLFRRSCLASILLSCLQTTYANPSLPQVVYGQVNFANQGKTLLVTNSPNAIINWQNFSIERGETTRFIQQNANSSVLNRILGQDPSRIFGSLQSNGRVFLINPNGILFGPNSQIDVNGLVASSLAISNQDFLAGKLKFSAGNGVAGKVNNAGSIRTPNGGQVYLIAPQVENSGVITSPNGEIMLAAGHTVQLVDSASPDLHVVVSAPEHQAVNLGELVAQAGQIGIYGALIKQRGTVNANSANHAVLGENGKVRFQATRDVLLEAGSTTLASGGSVQVLGERVGVTGDAKIDVSAPSGGGSILLGGDFQGANPSISNALQTYVGPEASLLADATMAGDGGKIIAWAERSTRFYGSASAHGAGLLGKGGLIETSGKQALDVAGARVSAHGAQKNGLWLLDPSDITVVHGKSGSLSSGLFDPSSSSSIGDSEINASLNGGTDVTLQTSGGTGGTGLIRINGTSDAGGAVQIANRSGGARSLSLITSGAIDMRYGATIDGVSDNSLAVNLNASEGITLSGTIDTAGAALSLVGNTTLGGTIRDSVLASSNTFTGNSGTLDNLTLDGSLNFSGSMFIKNGLTLANATTVNLGKSTLHFQHGSQSIASPGTATLNLAGGAFFAGHGQAGDTLTIGSGVTLQGYGWIGQSNPTSLNNLGTITANTSNQTLHLALTNLNNSGTLQSSTGVLSIEQTNWANSGTLKTTGGLLNLNFDSTTAALGVIKNSGGSVHWKGVLDNTNSTVDIGASGALAGLSSLGGTIKAGILQSSDTTVLNSQGATLDSVQVSGSLDLSGSAFIKNGITLADGASLNLKQGSLDFTSIGQHHIASTGAATLNLVGSGIGPAYGVSGLILHIDKGVTVQGYGYVGDYAFVGDTAATIINAGKIDANSNGNNLSVRAESLINQGTLAASAGTMTLRNDNWLNSSKIEVGTGTLNLDINTSTKDLGTIIRTGGKVNFQGLLDNSGATLDIGKDGPFGTGGLSLMNGVIKNGTLVSGDGSVLKTNSTTLDAVQISGNLSIDGAIAIKNDLSLASGANLKFSGSSAMVFAADAPMQTMHIVSAGPATINIQGGSIKVGQGTLHLDSQVTLQGWGEVSTFSMGGIVNHGTIKGNQSSQALNIGASSFANQGTVSVEAGSLNIETSNWTNTGTLKANSGELALSLDTKTASLGAIIHSGGEITWAGLLDNSNTTLDIGGGGNFGAKGLSKLTGTIKNGTLISSDSTPLVAGRATLDGVTISGNLTSAGIASNANNTTIKNGISLASGSVLNLDNNVWNFLGGDQHIATNGNATIELRGAILSPENQQNLYIDSGITIQGTGHLSKGSNAILFNAGKIDATQAGQPLIIDIDNVVNLGTLAVNGGNFRVSPSKSWSNSGNIEMSAGSLLLNLKTTTAGLGIISRTGGLVDFQGTLDNSGKTLDIGSNGPFGAGGLSKLSGTIKNGTLLSSDSTTLTGVNTTILDGVTLSGHLSATGDTAIENGILLADGANLDLANMRWFFTSGGTQHIATEGKATIKFDGSTWIAGHNIKNQTLQIDSGVTLQGHGALLEGNPTSFVNAGDILANTADKKLVLAYDNISNIGSLGVSNGTLQLTGLHSNAGVINIGAAGVVAINSGNLSNAVGGVIKGAGNLNLGSGTLSNSGTIQPGGSNQAATLQLTGNYIQTATGVLDVEVHGNANNADKFAISGTASLDGTLEVTASNGYVPAAGDQYNFLSYLGYPSGNFSTVNAPSFSGASVDLSSSGIMRLVMPGNVTNLWNFDGDGDWSDASKWSRGHVPTAQEDVQVPDYTSQFTITMSTPAQAARSVVFIGNDKLALASGSLTLGGVSSISNGVLDMLGSGELNLLHDFGVGSFNFGGTSQLNIGAGKTLTVGSFHFSDSAMLAGPGNFTVMQAYQRTGGAFHSNLGLINLTHQTGNLLPGAISGSNPMSLTANNGDIVLNGALVAGSARVTMSAPHGAIHADGNGGVTGSELVMLARDGMRGISSQHGLQITAPFVQAENTGSGDIKLSASGNLHISDLETQGFGIKNAQGGIFLQGDHVVVDAALQTTVGNIKLEANKISFANHSAAKAVSGDGNIFLSASGAEGISLAAQASLQVNGNAANVIHLTSDAMDLAGSIHAGPINGYGDVILQAFSALPLVVETNKSQGHLSITPTELGHISSNTLHLKGDQAGITLDASLTLPNINTVSLFSTEYDLTINSALHLPQSGSSITAASFSGKLKLGAAGALLADSVNLAAGSEIDLSAAAASSIGSSTADVNLMTDKLNFGSNGPLMGTTGNVMIGPYSEARDVHIVANPSAANVLELVNSQLQAIHADSLVISTSPSEHGHGNVSIDAALDLRGKVDQLSLRAARYGQAGGDISQQQSAALNVANLTLLAAHAVDLGSEGNLVDVLSAQYVSLSSVHFINGKDLTVGAGGHGIQAAGMVNLELTAGSLHLSEPVVTPNTVRLHADTLQLDSTITANHVQIMPATTGRAITIGSNTCLSSPCLLVNHLYKIGANSIVFGESDHLPSRIDIAGLTVGNSVPSDHAPQTLRIDLLSSGEIAQSAPILGIDEMAITTGGALNFSQANSVGRIAGSSAGAWNWHGSGNLHITNMTALPGSPAQTGISAGGAVALQTSGGKLLLESPLTAHGHTVNLNASDAILGAGLISAQSLHPVAGNGVNLTTAVSLLNGLDSGSGTSFKISNTGSLTVNNISQTNGGSISVDNFGAMHEIGTVQTDSGAISLKTHSPLTIDGTVKSTNGGAILLVAGASNSVSDVLTIGSSAVVDTTGSISLQAGNAVVQQDGSSVSPQAVVQAFQNTDPPVLPPNINACIADPTLTGCSSVLPNLDSCMITPSALGCTVVLPSLASCVSAPSTLGCDVVLPNLASCMIAPSAAGCSVVLPSLATCTITPSLPGCSVILPTLASCLADPAAAACSVVLPSLASCASTPSLPGCSAILPTLATCTLTPAAVGCEVVLPVLTTCLQTPTAPGCSVVLPNLNTCISVPSSAGCSVILPTLANCSVTPSLPGCSVVLPSVATCVVTPSSAGCNVVLPSLASCLATPSAVGCQVILPSLAQCTSSASLPGCSVVLPSLAACTSTPSLPGCSVVLPTVADCLTNPTLPNCATEIPVLNACLSNPNAAGCKEVTQSPQAGMPSLQEAIDNTVTLVSSSSHKPATTPVMSALAKPSIPETSPTSNSLPVEPTENRVLENKVSNSNSLPVEVTENRVLENKVINNKVAEAKTSDSKASDSKADDNEESKPDDKKDEKEVVVKKEEAKKEEPAKKMYCN